jgi:hypothetical protein
MHQIVTGFHGRANELEMLRQLDRERTLPRGRSAGPGRHRQTMLAARLAEDLTAESERVYWRSLRNAPPASEWLADAIGFLSDHRVLPPDGEARRTVRHCQRVGSIEWPAPAQAARAHRHSLWHGLSGEGPLLSSGGVHGTVKLWSVASGECLATMVGRTGAVRGGGSQLGWAMARQCWPGRHGQSLGGRQWPASNDLVRSQRWGPECCVQWGRIPAGQWWIRCHGQTMGHDQRRCAVHTPA